MKDLSTKHGRRPVVIIIVISTSICMCVYNICVCIYIYICICMYMYNLVCQAPTLRQLPGDRECAACAHACDLQYN